MKAKISLPIIILITLFGLFGLSYGVQKIFLGCIPGPERCTVLENQPTNYFPLVDTYGFMIDASGNGYLSDNVPPKNRILVISNTDCGFWFGVQSTFAIGGHVFNITSHADDLGQATHFFRSGNATGIWRTAKDGSSDIQIHVGWGDVGGSGFDIIRDRFVILNNSGPLFDIVSMDRAGGNNETWSLAPGAYFGGVGVFDDGRYVIVRQDGALNGVAFLYSGWNGILIQSQTFTGMAGAHMWVSVDNINNEAFISDYWSLHRWVISTNTITTYVGGVVEKLQNTYYDGWIYLRPRSLSAWRYSRDGSIIESWNGSQFIR